MAEQGGTHALYASKASDQASGRVWGSNRKLDPTVHGDYAVILFHGFLTLARADNRPSRSTLGSLLFHGSVQHTVADVVAFFNIGATPAFKWPALIQFRGRIMLQ